MVDRNRKQKGVAHSAKQGSFLRAAGRPSYLGPDGKRRIGPTNGTSAARPTSLWPARNGTL
jgi:hypothetical protein